MHFKRLNEWVGPMHCSGESGLEGIECSSFGWQACRTVGQKPVSQALFCVGNAPRDKPMIRASSPSSLVPTWCPAPASLPREHGEHGEQSAQPNHKPSNSPPQPSASQQPSIHISIPQAHCTSHIAHRTSTLLAACAASASCIVHSLQLVIDIRAASIASLGCRHMRVYEAKVLRSKGKEGLHWGWWAHLEFLLLSALPFSLCVCRLDHLDFAKVLRDIMHQDPTYSLAF